MNTAENRIDYISNRLHAHFLNEVGIPVLVCTEADWNYDTEHFGPTTACGWAWPLVTDENERIVAICPTVIARTTEHLPEEHLDDYLGIIEFVTDRHIALMVGFPDLDPWERHKKIIDNIQEDHPLALELLQEIQIAANS